VTLLTANFLRHYQNSRKANLSVHCDRCCLSKHVDTRIVAI